MTLKRSLILISLVVLVSFLAVPSSATPIPIAIKGTVTDLNEANQTLTIRAECQKYPCQYNLSGSFIGRAPNTVIFSRVKPGDVVEAVFKDWTFRVTDPSEGYTLPSSETRDLRQWYTIQHLAYQPGNGTLVATELFGDPAVYRVPFQGGYTISYRLYGPTPGIYDFRSFPPQTISNISVRRESGLNWSGVLATGESRNIPDPGDDTTLTMTFIGGYDAGYYAGKACPCANFHIRVLPENESGTVAWQETPATSSPAKTPLDPLAIIAGFGVLIVISGLKKR